MYHPPEHFGIGNLLRQPHRSPCAHRAEPTEKQLAAAKEAYAKFGARYSATKDQKEHVFTMPRTTTDTDLKGLPALPFRFVLNLQDTRP